jgi:hypothetical protein
MVLQMHAGGSTPPRPITLTANVGTEGATENFLIWTDFGFCDQFPFISLISARITIVYGAFSQSNSGAISDRARFFKYQFLSAI